MNCKFVSILAFLCLLPPLILGKNVDILVFTTDGDDKRYYASAVKTFTDYKIDYDVVSIPKSGISNEELEKRLYEEVNGSKMPKYKVLVFPNGRISYDHADYSRTKESDWQSALKYDQWEMFYEYSRSFNSRLVFLNEYPSNYTSTELYHEYKGDEAKSKYQLKQTLVAEKGIIEEETINAAGLTTEGIYHFPAKIVDNKNGVTAEPLLYFGPNDAFKEQTVAAVTVNNNNAEYVAFFMAFGDWSKDSTALNIVWLSWATQKDFKHLSGTNTSTEDAIKENGVDEVDKLEIMFITIATIISVALTIF